VLELLSWGKKLAVISLALIMTALLAMPVGIFAYAADDSTDLQESSTDMRPESLDDSFRILPDKDSDYKVLEIRTDNLSDDNIYSNLEAALQYAKTYASDAEPCKIVIPAGEYTTGSLYADRVLHVYSNTWIYAKGATITKIGEGGILRCGKAAENSSGTGAYCHIRIEGGTWDSDGMDAPKNCASFRFAHGSDITVKDLSILNNRGSHHIELGGVDNVTVSGCTFSGHYNDAGYGQEAIQIDALTSDAAFPDFPYYDNSICTNVTVTGCTFSGVFTGIGSHRYVDGSLYTGIRITDNKFSTISRYAVEGCGYQGAAITGNTVNGCGRQAMRFYCTSDSVIADNSINASGSEGIRIGRNSCGNSISGNIVSKSGKTGIILSGGLKNRISKNRITAGSSSGIRVCSGSKSAGLSGNSISYNKGYGIYVSGSSRISSLSGNILTGDRNREIYITGSCRSPVKSLYAIKISSAGKKKIKGKCQKKSIIKASRNGKIIGKTRASGSMRFSMKIKKTSGGTRVKLWVYDRKGNRAVRYVKIK